MIEGWTVRQIVLISFPSWDNFHFAACVAEIGGDVPAMLLPL